MRRRSIEVSRTGVTVGTGSKLAALQMAEGHATAAPQVVKVRRELLAACLTCPLCHKLLRASTTISECLHKFCRKCIYEKLNDEETYLCPVCNIFLGALTFDKLRADHSLQDVREKIFPNKGSKGEALEEEVSTMVLVNRKENSLSSLVVNTHLAAQRSLKGRRTKLVTRRAATLHGASPAGESTEKEDNKVDNHVDKSNSIEKKIKVNLKRKEALAHAVAKEEHNHGSSIEVKTSDIMVEINPHKLDVLEEESMIIQMPPVVSKESRMRRVRRRKELAGSAQMPLDGHRKSFG